MPSAVTRPHCDAWEIAARATGLRDAGVGVGVGVQVGVGAAEVAALWLRVNQS